MDRHTRRGFLATIGKGTLGMVGLSALGMAWLGVLAKSSASAPTARAFRWIAKV